MARIQAQLIDGASPALQAAMPRIMQRAEQVLERAGLRMAGRVQQYLKTEEIYASGELRKSIASRVTALGGPNTLQAIVSSGENYAEYVHEGRGPGSPPPVRALYEWVLRKSRQGKIVLNVTKGAKYRHGPKKGKLKTQAEQKRQAALGIAFAIQHRIAQRGIKGRPFFDIVFDKHGRAIRYQTEREMATAVREELNRG